MEPVSKRRWVSRSSAAAAEREGELARALDLTPLTARILLARGIDSPAEARLFIDGKLADLPDPLSLLGMERAVARLLLAWRRQERVRIHGDYDVDGITATALLTEGFSQLGLHVDYHIPLRLKDGYGLSVEALEAAATEGIAVVVSVDCGVSAVAEAERARELELDLIVTDHHQVPDELPRAHALINPHQPGCLFPFKDLAGVGVAFFLLVALRKALREAGAFAGSKEPDLRRLLDLVALGSIADLVPLTGLNRLLTRIGLHLLDRQPRPGIHALRQVAAVDKVTCGTVGFRLAPRLNAAGRLEDAALGVELLLGRDADTCREQASLLDGFNRERQAIEKETLEQAVATLAAGREETTHSIVLADARWHPGVIGIVASRLVERYHRPTVLISLDSGQGKGSARSIRGFHLYQALERCRERLLGFGGHAYAAGLSIAEAEVAEFARAFEEVARELLSPEDLHPHLGHDGEVLLDELDPATVGELARLAPFGMGNPEPAFIVGGVHIQQAAVVGGDHLRFVARQDGYSLPCIAFGMAARQGELSGPMDLLFSPSINEWKGRFDVQLQIKDFRPSA